MSPLTQSSAWHALAAHREKFTESKIHLRDLLQDLDRHQALTLACSGMHVDFTRHLVTSETIALLVALAQARDVENQRDRMFAGEKINISENRAVLHTVLRASKEARVCVGGENVVPFVQETLQRMRSFSTALRSGAHTGYTGQAITDIVNIGIGGSDLGPRFATRALADFHDGPRTHFVSNVDGSVMEALLRRLDPARTLFIVASKTFTTEETLLNAHVARDWFLAHAPQTAIAQHFVALSTNAPAVTAFGIAPDTMFPFRDWVGGRYSLWSAIGLSLMIAIGPDRFDDLLQGARSMDDHFRTAPLGRNIPVLMGLLGVWYRNFWGYPAHLLLPYDQRLEMLAKYTQQLDMESNGKAVTREGEPIDDYQTGPLLFGEPGTDSQHSFMQLIHQSQTPVPADFILAARPHHALHKNHASLCSNFLAQMRALALGQTLEEAGGDTARVFTGNRPTSAIILDDLTPLTLGALIAAYEHKVFVQGVIWGVNSFDQPGVELGKKLAGPIATALSSGDTTGLDPSTARSITLLRAQQNRPV